MVIFIAKQTLNPRSWRNTVFSLVLVSVRCSEPHPTTTQTFINVSSMTRTITSVTYNYPETNLDYERSSWLCKKQELKLFTTARIRKQLRCPSADEWIRKLWCLYTADYYSAIKRNAFESVLMRWMKLKPIIQKEVSEKERQISYINAYIWNLERWYQWFYMQGSKGDTDLKNRLLDSVGEGEGGMIWEKSTERYNCRM